MDTQLIIAKDDVRTACRDTHGNYYFRYTETNAIQPSTEKEVKEWCKQFNREDIMDRIAKIFHDDPSFQITTIEFHVPGWLRDEFLDYRDRNSLTTDSAFYRLWKDEKDYINSMSSEVQIKYHGVVVYLPPYFFMKGTIWKRDIISTMLGKQNRIRK